MRSIVWYFLLATLALGLICIAGGIASLRVYTMPSGSMEPTLRNGEKIIELRRLLHIPLRRGQLVAFHRPDDLTQEGIARVIGLPGDSIRIAAGKLLINGSEKQEPYIWHSSSSDGDFPQSQHWSLGVTGLQASRLEAEMYSEWVKNDVLVVPEGRCFVLADRRAASVDSRHFGPIPDSEIFALPLLGYRNSDYSDIRHVE